MAQRIKKIINSNIFQILSCVILFFGVFAIIFSLIGSQALVHDEAVYLTKARAWTEGTPANEFKIYRPIGMAWFGVILLQFGDSEQVARIFGAFFGSLTIVFIYLLFNRLFVDLFIR